MNYFQEAVVAWFAIREINTHRKFSERTEKFEYTLNEIFEFTISGCQEQQFMESNNSAWEFVKMVVTDRKLHVDQNE